MQKEKELRTLALSVVGRSVRRHVDMEGLNATNIDIDVYFEHLGNDLVVKLTQRRAVQKLPTFFARSPETWWDHFKETFFPEWLKAKFPVKFRELAVTPEAYYDHIALPNDRPEVVIHVTDEITTESYEEVTW